MLIEPQTTGAHGIPFQRPLRWEYVHTLCGGRNRLKDAKAREFAASPRLNGRVFCRHCGLREPVSEFTWLPDGSVMGT